MKDMLTQNDLKQIGDLMDAKLDNKFGDFEQKVDGKFVKFEGRIVDRIIGEVGEVIEQNINPQFEAVRNRLDKIELRMDTQMVTKSYLDDKLAPIGGKINVLVDVLHRNGTISDDQRRVVHA